jgi:hypothetical protein
VCVAEDSATIALDAVRQPGEELEWMELCLARKPQGEAAVPEIDRDALDDTQVAQARALGGLELLFHVVTVFSAGARFWCKQVAVNPHEVAVDEFFLHDQFTIDRCRVAGNGVLRAFGSVHVFDSPVAIVEPSRDVRRGSSRFAIADRAVVQNDDALPCFRQQ